jgi:hypothetical protein
MSPLGVSLLKYFGNTYIFRGVFRAPPAFPGVRKGNRKINGQSITISTPDLKT